jgi:hypothetical protein
MMLQSHGINPGELLDMGERSNLDGITNQKSRASLGVTASNGNLFGKK